MMRACLGLALVLLGSMRAAAPPHPAPPATEILRRVLAQPANQPTHERLLDSRYHYVRTQVFEVRAGDGDLLRREDKRTVHSPDQRAGEEDDAIVPTDAKGGRGKAYTRADFRLDEALLARFDFIVVGTEEVQGRGAWVMEVQPATHLPPMRDLKDRFLSRTAGRVWVDTEEAVVVRASFRLLSPVAVVGGLVGSVKRCDTEFERQRTEAGDWFTRRFDWQLEGRKLFARRLLRLHEERTDVRPDPGVSRPKAHADP